MTISGHLTLGHVILDSLWDIKMKVTSIKFNFSVGAWKQAQKGVTRLSAWAEQRWTFPLFFFFLCLFLPFFFNFFTLSSSIWPSGREQDIHRGRPRLHPCYHISLEAHIHYTFCVVLLGSEGVSPGESVSSSIEGEGWARALARVFALDTRADTLASGPSRRTNSV